MKLNLKFKITVVLVLQLLFTQAQIVLDLQFTDQYKRPLPFTNVNYKGSTKISDATGFLRIGNYTKGSKIEIHKLGFTDTTIIPAAVLIAHDTIKLTLA